VRDITFSYQALRGGGGGPPFAFFTSFLFVGSFFFGLEYEEKIKLKYLSLILLRIEKAN